MLKDIDDARMQEIRAMRNRTSLPRTGRKADEMTQWFYGCVDEFIQSGRDRAELDFAEYMDRFGHDFTRSRISYWRQWLKRVHPELVLHYYPPFHVLWIAYREETR